MSSLSSGLTRVFISYSHQDSKYLTNLHSHLADIQRKGLIDLWSDTKIHPGADWKEEIKRAIKSAKIAILLVSADFIASQFIVENELPPLLEAAKAGGTIILPVILKPCSFEDTSLSQFQAVNSPAMPLTKMKGYQRDELWVKVARDIKRALLSTSSENPPIGNQQSLSGTPALGNNSSTDFQIKQSLPERELQKHPSLDEQIALWFEASASRSARTKESYEETITQYRAVLRENGLDLDSQDENAVAPLAQQWAASSSIEGKEVAPSTFNMRLSILSSFYKFAYKHRWIRQNPIEWVERREEQRNNNAAIPLEPAQVKKGLKSIDRSSLRGKRDYAILQILLKTGRTVSEVAAMRYDDITIEDKIVKITFPKCRGGKVMVHNLPITSATAKALLDYLGAVYDGDARVPDAPVWKALSRPFRRKGFVALGIHGIAGVCQKYLGTSKVSTTRQTWLKLQEGIGAKELEDMLNID